MTADFTAPDTNTPMSILVMLRRTVRIYLTNLLTILKIAVTISLPAQLILGFLVNKLYPELIDMEKNVNDQSSIDPLLLTLLAYLLLELIGFLVYSIAAAAIMDVAKNAHAGFAKTTYSAAINTAKSCFLKIFVALILISIGVGIGLGLLIFPGIYLAISWWLTYPIIVIESKGIVGSMSKSWKLTANYRCDIFKVYATYLASYFVIVVVINMVLITILAPRLVRYIFGYCIPSLSIGPLGLILSSVVYFDLRARKESLTRDRLALEIQEANSSISAPRFDLGNVNSPSEITGGERVDQTFEISAAVQPQPPKKEAVQSKPSESIWDEQQVHSAAQKYNDFC